MPDPSPHAAAMNIVVDLLVATPEATNDDGDRVEDYQVTQSAVPARVLRDSAYRPTRAFEPTLQSDEVHEQILVAFASAVVLPGGRSRVRYVDPQLGTRLLDVIRCDNVHQMGKLWVATCLERPI